MQHSSSHFCRSEVWHDPVGFSALGLTSQYQDVDQAGLLFGGPRKESASKLIQIVDQFQLLAVVELRSPFPCWLSVRASHSSRKLPQFLFIWPPTSLNQQQHTESHLVLLLPLTFTSTCRPEKAL